MRHWLFLAYSVISFCGCASKVESPADKQNSSASALSSACTLYSSADADNDRIRLQESKALWQSLGTDSYQYVYDLTSDRFPPITFSPSVVVVSGGLVTEVFDVVTGEYLNPLSFGSYDIKTVDEWFVYLEDEINSDRAFKLSISFNSEFGYPNFIDINLAPCGGYDGASTYVLYDLQ